MLDIKFVDWMVKDAQANKLFSISLYDGRLIFKVRNTADRNAQPYLNKRVTLMKSHMIEKVAEKIMAASPETKISVKFSDFDKNSKQWRLSWVITFEKDAKMCYRLHLTDAASSQTHVFALRGPSDVSIGSDVMSDADKSIVMMKDLISWFTSARIWAPATVRPFDPNKKPGGGSGGPNGWKGNGGYGRGGGNGGGGWNRGGGNGGGSYGGGGGQSAATTGGDSDGDGGLPF